MGTRMLRRGSGAVLLGAAVCALALPVAAHAEEGPDPIISGDCAATFAHPDDADGTPLTADAGAAAEAPGVLTVGTGSESVGTNKHAEPLVTLAASDTLDAVGVSGTPVVSDTASGVCRVAKPVVNGAGGAVQDIVPGDDVTEPGEDGPAEALSSDNQPSDTPVSETSTENEDAPDTDGAVSTVSATEGADEPDESSEVDLSAALDDSFETVGAITLPPAVTGSPVHAPDLTPDQGEEGPAERANESGNVQAVPSNDSPQRLPLLLAVIALAVVVTALSKSFYSRQST